MKEKTYLGGMGVNSSASSLASCSSVFCEAISSGVGGGSHDETKRRDWAIETLIVACMASSEVAVGTGIGNSCCLAARRLEGFNISRVRHATRPWPGNNVGGPGRATPPPTSSPDSPDSRGAGDHQNPLRFTSDHKRSL